MRTPSDSVPDRALLLEQYGPGIWALCRKLAAHPEDAYQDVWARIFTKLDHFDPAGTASLKTWLHTVAHRRLIDLHRKQQSHGQVLPLTDLPSDSDPEGTVSRQRRRDALDAALAQLPEAHRRVVLLHHLAGHPLTAVASAEGVALGTIKSRLHRARARLAELLEDQR